jgi:UDPglucose 6-dehydrogenase
VSLRVVESVVAVNDARKTAMARKVVKACGGDVQGKTIAVLGLTFKPNTDDMREAPSINIIDALQRAGARIRAHDPVGMEAAKSMLHDVTYATDAYDCAEGADALVLITEWDAYRALDLERLKQRMRARVVVDLRNVYRDEEMARHGFDYVRVGAKPGVTEPSAAAY